ncbi:MAG: hypothetical protein IJ057_11175 [Bacteroidales bacterium]|nr:hypothetical protein [Bacteroidales bacterium]
MKKVFPLLLFVLLAFAGCNSGSAEYEMTQDPRQISVNAEKFASQVAKKSKHYKAEDWNAAVKQFVVMGKNYYEYRNYLTAEEQMAFDNARMKFIGAVDATGNEELALHVKEEYGRIIGN